MRSLRRDQRRLQGAILAGRGGNPSTPKVAMAAGIAIYDHAYRARLAGALRTSYPGTAQWLGAAKFHEMAVRYAAAYPSRHFSLRWHGEDLPAFLGARPVADLARMEWALGEAFDAADAMPLEAADVAAMGAEACAHLPLALHPAARVLDLQWSVEPAWRALRDGVGVEGHDVALQPHKLLVWRRELDAHWRTVSSAEAAALLRLRDAGTLAAACDGMREADAARLGEYFAGWIAQGLLVKSPRGRA